MYYLKNLGLLLLLGLTTSLTEVFAHNDLLARVLNVVVMSGMLVAQFVIYATTLSRPAWYLTCERLAMGSTLLGIVLLIWLPAEGVFLGGQVIRFGLAELLIATAVYRFFTEKSQAYPFLRQRWYYPLVLLSLLISLFVIAEQWRQNRALEQEKVESGRVQADSIQATTDLTLGVTQANRTTLQRDSLEGRKRTELLNELVETVNFLLAPILGELRQIRIEQHRQRIWQQKQDMRRRAAQSIPRISSKQH